ncbi:MAG TPA: DUF397 domain-containing protein [Candidatus Stackebrandtia excrementipullorum]|nr:DUF397 domain-containing protein [Candidatus Stackebrandtia excrementipullorum]
MKAPETHRHLCHELDRSVSWRKPSRSGGSGNGANCVEVGRCDCPGVVIRDSKQRASGTLLISIDEWAGVLATIRNSAR